MDESERQACRMYLAMLAATLIGVAAFLWIGAFRPGATADARAALGCLALILAVYQAAFTEVRGWL